MSTRHVYEHLEEIQKQRSAASPRHALEKQILALCDAVFNEASQALIKAKRIKGDSPDGGDLEQRANHLLGVYDQLYAAYAVAVGS